MIGFLRFGTLERYCTRLNLFFLFASLTVGTCIYLLADLFDRLDDFMEAGLGVFEILYYYGVKVPLIFTQIIPAVFLLAIVIQMGVMNRSREIVALRAGGVSLNWFVRFFVFYALIWSCGQFLFSQYVAVYGAQEASRIWKEDVRKTQLDEVKIKNLWFSDGPYIVQAEEAFPSRSRATGITVYEFEMDSQRMIRIIKAEKALVDENGWGLLGVREMDTRSFENIERLSLFLPVRQNLQAFRAAEANREQGLMPLWELSELIKRLEASGSNVEDLRTVWHSKWAYSFTLVVMALMGLALLSFSENMYANVGLALALIFVHYGLYVVGVSAGQKGILPPFVGAWFANVVMAALASLRLLWVGNPRFEAWIKDWLGILPLRRA
ncbi:LptF/LptG family permease [Salidesulfovibrio onnuriiensis]|uniref:LptF/LptG family permease n=1 Tax=Salidesulfovibrio onnuriiensis TaxID=2583823 RepID=UPI00202B15B7|nr:LptF/LptG family permease [Salidesulfovibrio onnuriiensis]